VVDRGKLEAIIQPDILYFRSEGYELPRALARGLGLPFLMGFSPMDKIEVWAKAHSSSGH
jgi:hypothetical protein